MKISIEFTSMRDMLTSLPKFAELIGGEGTTEERFSKALADDGQPLVIKLTPTDGKAITPEEREGVKAAIVEELAKTRLPEASESPAQDAREAQESEEAPKASKSKAKAEKPASEAKTKPEAGAPKEADVRTVFNSLIQAGKRDKLKDILESFGASNFSGLKAEDYAEAIEKAKAELGEV